MEKRMEHGLLGLDGFAWSHGTQYKNDGTLIIKMVMIYAVLKAIEGLGLELYGRRFWGR